MSVARSLGELRHSSFTAQRLGSRRVKDELRENLMAQTVIDEDLATIEGTFEVNLFAVIRLTRALLPLLRKGSTEPYPALSTPGRARTAADV